MTHARNATLLMVFIAPFLVGGSCNGTDAPADGTLQLFYDVNVDAMASLGLANLTSIEAQSGGLLALAGKKLTLDAGGKTVLAAQNRIVPGPTYAVAPGFVTQLRIEQPVVRFRFGDGSSEDVRVPSGPQTGWKIVVDETKFPNGYPIASGHVTGVRLFLTLGDLFHRTGAGPGKGNSGTWMARPTIESDQFNVADSAGYDPDIIVVVFDPAASNNQIQSAIAAGGYAVEFAYPRSPPKLYKIKLPPGRNLRDAHSYFRSLPFVLAAAPSVVMRPRLTPSEGTPLPLGAIGAETGWQAIANKLGRVGDPKVVLAAISHQGINVAHADLANNIWLNQDEIAAVCPKAMCDVDGEPGITLKDFNHPSFPAQFKPQDIQPNGRVDCDDLTSLTSPYRNGKDDPVPNGNGFTDDICGFAFPDSPSIGGADTHDTGVVGIMGAIGNNQPQGGGVGVCWSCRVMPLGVAVSLVATLPRGKTAELLSAVTYAAQNGAHVANFSAGLVLIPDNQPGLCPSTAGLPVAKEAFTTVVTELNAAVAAVLPPPGAPTPLLTLAMADGCGNGADDGNANVYDFPSGAFFDSPGWRATSITVGASVAVFGQPGPYEANDNVGGPLEIAAPGNWTRMLDGVGDGNTFSLSGSSFAAPVVAGVAGLIVAGNLAMFPAPDGALLKFQLLTKHVAVNPALGSSVPGQREITMALLP